MNMPLKEIKCRCGEVIFSDKKKVWCDKCGHPVFYDPKDARRHRFNSFYIVGLIVATFTFLTYIFLEMIATPLLR